MEDKKINNENLQALLAEFLKQGYIVVSETKDGTGYKAVKEGNEVVINSHNKPSNTSFKQFVFPKAEPILYYKKDVDDVRLIDPPAPKKTVIVGAKPCDAKSVSVLSKVFNWDYRDDFFNGRVENTIVIGTLCEYKDEFCFCTSVGIDPASTDGTDLFLVPLASGSYGVKIVSEKGQEFIQPFLKYFEQVDTSELQKAGEAVEPPAPKFESAKVKEWIDRNFDNPYWATLGETCLGCAQCAFACPVCHCFDIVDEEPTYGEGRRMKNWDACQFGLFTKHASGHNPRDDQGGRYRQRISHKFAYYPERFGEILCTGCGRCSRGCVVGMDIAEVAGAIGKMEANKG